MPTNSLPLIIANDHPNLLAVDDRFLEIQQPQLFGSFLYIGDKNATFRYFANYFKTGIHVSGFDEAINKIFKLSADPLHLPEVILIDTPLINQR